MSDFNANTFFQDASLRLREGLSNIVSLKRVEMAPIIEDIGEIVSRYPEKVADLYGLLRSFLEEHVSKLRDELETLQSDLLIEYVSRWKIYSLSLNLIMVCFDKLNSYFSRKPQRARPPTSSSVKPGSRFISGTSSMISSHNGADNKDVGVLALQTWKKIMFLHFQERLLHDAFSKINQDRVNTFSLSFESSDSFDHHSTANQASSSNETNLSLFGLNNQQRQKVLSDKIYGSKQTTWVPMGGDNFVREFVESILKLGEAGNRQPAAPSSDPLKFYQETFERTYMTELEQFYKRETAAYIENYGIASFLSHAISRFSQEQLRGLRYLHSSSKDKLTNSIHSILISDHQDLMIHEFEPMLNQERRNDMKNLHFLLSKLQESGTKQMHDILYDWIVKVSFDALKDLVASSEMSSSTEKTGQQMKRVRSDRGNASFVQPAQYVELMTSLYHKFESLVNESFNNDTSFVTTMDRAYRTAVNSNSMCEDLTLVPELMARYSDLLLRKGGSSASSNTASSIANSNSTSLNLTSIALSESELETKLNELIAIFRYVDDKDIFQNFYSKMLAKRLINAASISEDAERVMLAGLKTVCTSEYVLRIQRMFTDINVSAEVTEKFKEYSKSTETTEMETSNPESTEDQSSQNRNAVKKSANIDFNVFVLTTGSWPLLEQNASFNVPEEISLILKKFSNFYNTLHNGRKLTWMYNLHRGEMKTTFAKKRYEISATAYQIAVLLVFATHSQATVEQITTIVGLNNSDALSVIKNLIECKLIVLASEAESATTNNEEEAPKRTKKSIPALDSSTLLALNTSFVSKRLKFKLPAPLPSDSAVQQAAASTRTEVDEDRAQFLQAIIVRTMKTRKLLNHTQLVQEVIEQTKNRFKASVSLIKRQIDVLIEKEYLARTKEKTDVYQYCA